MQHQFRLRRSADFERLRTEGRTWRHPFLIMSAAPNALVHNRYGFITSRHLGGAVVRNRVRRLLREAVRQSMPWLRSGYDVTLVARNGIVNKPYSTIMSALEELFKRADLWQEEGKT